MLLRVAGLSLGLLGAGCATIVPPPRVETPAQKPPEAAWARVLQDNVDEQGRVNFVRLAGHRADLDEYVAWIYEHSPQEVPALYPTPSAVLAYHLNAYNALAMYNILEAGIPQSLSGFAKVRFFYLRKVRIGGEPMTLYAYETDVVRKLGEPRVHFALNCMSVGCPHLPREPFRADAVDAQLQREAHRFFNEERNVRLDAAKRTVYLSEILKFYTDDFLKAAPSLIAFVNRYRDTPVPEDYSVKFTDYNWTVNAQPAP